MGSVDDAPIAARLDEGEPSPWDLLTSSLVEPDLTVLGPAEPDPGREHLYAAFWGEPVAERLAPRRRRRWLHLRPRVT